MEEVQGLELLSTNKTRSLKRTSFFSKEVKDLPCVLCEACVYYMLCLLHMCMVYVLEWVVPMCTCGIWNMTFGIFFYQSLSCCLVPRSLIEPEAHHFGYVGWPVENHPVPTPPMLGL